MQHFSASGLRIERGHCTVLSSTQKTTTQLSGSAKAAVTLRSEDPDIYLVQPGHKLSTAAATTEQRYLLHSALDAKRPCGAPASPAGPEEHARTRPDSTALLTYLDGVRAAVSCTTQRHHSLLSGRAPRHVNVTTYVNHSVCMSQCFFFFLGGGGGCWRGCLRVLYAACYV